MINDFYQVLSKTTTILYADDTVVYCVAKNAEKIGQLLNHDLKNIENWLDHNNLYINLKQGKTEWVLYGSQKRLLKQPEISIKIYDKSINESKVYKYLGVHLDNHLNLQHNSEKVYKKALSRVKLLSCICEQVGRHVAESIYKAMIRPILMYCCQQQLGLPKSTIDKLQSIQNRAAKVANPFEPPQCWEKVADVRNRRVTIDVFKCLNGLHLISSNKISSVISAEKTQQETIQVWFYQGKKVAKEFSLSWERRFSINFPRTFETRNL